MALIAYGKIGRAIALTHDGWGVVGGDMEPPRLLKDLATRNPHHTFVIVSTCRDDPQACGYPPNVVNAWTPERLDWYKTTIKPYQETMREVSKTDPAMLEAIRGLERTIDALLLPLAEKIGGAIIWAGQHGTANSVLPAVTERSGIPGYTRPYDSFVFYGGGIYRLVNAWRDLDPWGNEEVWLIADARNYLKARDQRWPLRHPVLGQFNFTRNLHHERFEHPMHLNEWNRNVSAVAKHSKQKTHHTWESPIDYVYSGLEACSTTPDHIDNVPFVPFTARRPFGIFINEAGFHVGQGKAQEAAGRLARAPIVQEWVLPLMPTFVHGKWTDASQKKLGITVDPAPFEQYFPLMSSIKCTFTTPSSGSGWATTKPWEAFACRTVCFKHPGYDTQNHIYGRFSREVQEWLCPKTPQDLWTRVRALEQNQPAWEYLTNAQYELYTSAVGTDKRWLRMIEERINV